MLTASALKLPRDGHPPRTDDWRSDARIDPSTLHLPQRSRLQASKEAFYGANCDKLESIEKCDPSNLFCEVSTVGSAGGWLVLQGLRSS
jgi:hypothetical protein